jgi:uncharacterized damage-inducible protein DinB
MKEFLQELFRYNQEANRHHIQVISNMASGDDEILKVFSHILNSHAIWLDRIKGHRPRYKVWEVHDPGTLSQINYTVHKQTHAIISNEGQGYLDRIVGYTNSRGYTYENRIREILFHAYNHSAHHRGQVARMIREAGTPPPVADYIILRRKPISEERSMVHQDHPAEQF